MSAFAGSIGTAAAMALIVLIGLVIWQAIELRAVRQANAVLRRENRDLRGATGVRMRIIEPREAGRSLFGPVAKWGLR